MYVGKISLIVYLLEYFLLKRLMLLVNPPYGPMFLITYTALLVFASVVVYMALTVIKRNIGHQLD